MINYLIIIIYFFNKSLFYNFHRRRSGQTTRYESGSASERCCGILHRNIHGLIPTNGTCWYHVGLVHSMTTRWFLIRQNNSCATPQRVVQACLKALYQVQSNRIHLETNFGIKISRHENYSSVSQGYAVVNGESLFLSVNDYKLLR